MLKFYKTISRFTVCGGHAVKVFAETNREKFLIGYFVNIVLLGRLKMDALFHLFRAAK